jgi:hypothetical protein
MSYYRKQYKPYQSKDQLISANDLCDLDDDDEDRVIYERRCYESEKKMTPGTRI